MVEKSSSNNRDDRFAPSFTISNKIKRVLWQIAWFLFARFSPPSCWRWRRMILIIFGAKIGRETRIYSSVDIWLPSNLIIGERSMLGRGINCYNQGLITIGSDVVVSWNVTLCSSTHDVEDPRFPLLLRPITIGDHAWIAAEAFVGPGATIGTGAVLGARAAARGRLEAWAYYSGNPATFIKPRPPIIAADDSQ